MVMAGAEFSIVILSSSPPAPELCSSQDAPPSGQRVAMRAYPPFSASPPVSPRRSPRGALVSGSRATIVPPEVARGFATVSSLVRSEHFAPQLDEESTEIRRTQSKRASLGDTGDVLPAKTSRKRVTKASAAVEGATPKPKSKPRARKPKIEKDNTEVEADPELRAAPNKSSCLATDASIEPTGVAPKLTKAGNPRKPRATKEKVGPDAESELKPKRTRVTKPKATKVVTKAVEKTQREDARIVSAHFRDRDDDDVTTTEHAADHHGVVVAGRSIWDVPSSPRPKKQALSKEPQDPLVEGLDLEEAVARRRDWTPPKDSAVSELQTPVTDSTGKKNASLAGDANASFGNMLTSFAYAQSPSARSTATMTNPMAETIGPAKRRRAELAGVPNNQTSSRNSSPGKGKAPKKKPRTITDIVTEQYASKESISDQAGVTSDSFESRTSTTVTTTIKQVPSIDASDFNGDSSLKRPPRRKTTSKVAGETTVSKTRIKKTTAKSKAKAKPVVETLLSPASAALRMNRQDVLFGTSSQLAIEESPSTVRQIQLAIKESERDADLFSDMLSLAPPHWPKLGKAMGKNNLWDVGARDHQGGLLEEMEDVYIPEPDRTQDIPLLMDGIRDESDVAREYVDIDELEPPLDVVVSSDPPTPPRLSKLTPQHKVPPVEHTPTEIHIFKDIKDFEQPPPPSNQHAESQNSFADIDDFDFPPSAQLHFSPLQQIQNSAPVTSNGSPKKRQGRPPKSQSAVSTVKPLHTPRPKSPKSALKRSHDKAEQPSPILSRTPPRSIGRFVDIEEILDSEDEALETLSPAPPQISSSPDIPLALSSKPPPSLISTSSLAYPSNIATASLTTADDVTKIHRIPASHLEYSSFKPHLFAQITSHIRGMTPTTDSMKPNWHEKILMYDPIVLEDLTAYLNTYTSIRLYKRATQKQIKAWNKHEKKESEKKLGAKTKAKQVTIEDDAAVFSMDGDLQDVLAVEKELEATMVRDWCESLSVCTIWSKEGRKKGTARKGFY